MAVFVTITTIVMFAFVDGQRHQDLKDAAAAVAGDLRQIQTLALANNPLPVCANSFTFGQNCAADAECDPSGKCGLVPSGGYGLTITQCATPPCSYRLYGDIRGTGLTDPANYLYDSTGAPADPTISVRSLPKQVIVKSVQLDSGPTTFPVSLNVYPPKPTTRITVDEATPITSPKVTVCLEHLQTGRGRTISLVAASGQVNDVPVASCP